MQGMIMHHEQAVEMVDLIGSRTQNTKIKLLGARIANSQLDEIKLMKRWLESRGESTEHKMPQKETSSSHSHGAGDHQMLMPGMLSKEQMEALKKAKGAEFDKLFLGIRPSRDERSPAPIVGDVPRDAPDVGYAIGRYAPDERREGDG